MKNLLDELTKDLTLPDGCDQWGIRSVHPDFRSRNDFRWPFPGNKAVAPGPINPDNHDGCPSNWLSDGTPTKGDGICVAKSWRGMASSSIPAITLLLVAYSTSHVLGSSQLEDKHRVSECVVVEVVDGARLVSESGTDADLSRADLSGANLYGANLSRADLSRANLSRADLSRANADAYTTCPTGYKVDNNRIVVTS